MTQISNPRVCVIGAGIAGLTSARYLKDEGINFTVLESTRYVGGIWRYDPRIGTDENGLPLRTGMYKRLRIYLPKPAMELGGFPFPDDAPTFMKRELFYQYLEDYVKHFELESHIKFLHNVTLVSREGNVWVVKYQNVVTNETFEEEFDFVFVGTGQFNKPFYPNNPSEELFSGTIIHSHDYRESDRYTDRRVLVVGVGPSGLDITTAVAKVSKTLVHSVRPETELKTVFPDNYIRKPNIKEFNATGVIFEDGSYEDIDDVIYCTGFQYYYPFLDKSCGLEVNRKSVTPLYKCMVNINQPTMILLGVIRRGCLVVAMDAQARYAMAIVKGHFTLPSKEKMLEDWNKQFDTIRSKGQPLSEIHVLGDNEDKYYEDLTEESGIDRVKPYVSKIFDLLMESANENIYTFRDYLYNIIDDKTIIKIPANSAEETC